jgi:hypothetical protein
MTEKTPFFPPSIALLTMAARLAAQRVPCGDNEFGGMQTYPGQFHPTARAECLLAESLGGLPLTSSEYWRILDRISKGEKP